MTSSMTYLKSVHRSFIINCKTCELIFQKKNFTIKFIQSVVRNELVDYKVIADNDDNTVSNNRILTNYQSEAFHILNFLNT